MQLSFAFLSLLAFCNAGNAQHYPYDTGNQAHEAYPPTGAYPHIGAPAHGVGYSNPYQQQGYPQTTGHSIAPNDANTGYTQQSFPQQIPNVFGPEMHWLGAQDGFHHLLLNEREFDRFDIADMTRHGVSLGVDVTSVRRPGTFGIFRKPIHALRNTAPGGNIMLTFKSKSFPNIFRRKWVIYNGYNTKELKKSDIVAEVKRKRFSWFRPQLLVYMGHKNGKNGKLRYILKSNKNWFQLLKSTSFNIVDSQNNQVIGSIKKERFDFIEFMSEKQRYGVKWKVDSELDYRLAITLGVIIDEMFHDSHE